MMGVVVGVTISSMLLHNCSTSVHSVVHGIESLHAGVHLGGMLAPLDQMLPPPPWSLNLHAYSHSLIALPPFDFT